VPTAVVEELPSARAQEREHVLEVGSGGRRGAECRWIEDASANGQDQEACETATDLEATRADVLMGQAVASEVQDRPEQ
jgi:hypothetical protein